MRRRLPTGVEDETVGLYVADNLLSFQTWWLLLEKARRGDPNRVARVIHMQLDKRMRALLHRRVACTFFTPQTCCVHIWF